MSYTEYKDLFERAQIIGQYHLFVYDIIHSRKGITQEERGRIVKLIFQVYEKIEEIEEREHRSILHRNKNLVQGKLKVEKLGRGMTWFDTGTHDALIETASFVQTIEKRQGLQVCCPEEIAYKNKWITAEQLSQLAEIYMKTEYGKYLKDLAENKFGEE